MQSALITIEQEKGVVARTYGVHVDAAFELGARLPRRNDHRLSDVAGNVVTAPSRLRELTPAT